MLKPILLSALTAVMAACAGGGLGQVSPQEAPELAARVAQDPGNPSLLVRYAASLFAAGSCDTAQTVARRAMAARPGDAVPVLILGQCQERAGEHDRAIAGYGAYLAANAAGQGAPAVRARALLARRDQASDMARRALIQEQQLAQQPGDPGTVGILPLQIVGDTSYQSLSRGLAQMIISDIGLLRQFRLVERLHLGALLDEIRFAQGSRVDPATAARVGRLVQAGRMVQGLATIPDQGPVRLEASVVQGTGEVASAEQVSGQIRDLMRMEKDLVVAIVAQLGYTLSVAERRAILENGTQNLQAFLAYSRGLVAEDAGDFSRAALHFGDAVQADPGFQAARDEQAAAAAAPEMQASQGGDLGAVVSRTGEQAPSAPVAGALLSGLNEMAGNKSEGTAPGPANTGQQANNTNTGSPAPTPRAIGASETVTGVVGIKIPIP